LLGLVPKTTKKANASSLFDRWNLPDLPSKFEFVDDETAGLDFLFEYPIAKSVATPDNVDISLYDQGCKYNDGDPPVELLKGTTEDVSFQGTTDTVIAGADVTLGNSEMNVAGLLNEYPTLWDEEKSRITFCVRFSLMTEDIEVNFLETLVVVDVVLEVSFTVLGISVAPKEKITSSTRVLYEVKAYLCGGKYQPLLGYEEITTISEVCDPETGEYTTIETTTTKTNSSGVTEGTLSDAQKEAQKEGEKGINYPQGSVIRVCIRPDDTALGQVTMRIVDSLVFEGTYNNQIAPYLSPVAPTTSMGDGIYTQVAVKNGSTDVSRWLSAMSCDTGRLEGRPDVVVCAVDTILVSDFYWRVPGTASTVRVWGLAELKFGSIGGPSRQRGLERIGTHDDQQLHPKERNTQAALDTVWNMTRPNVDYSAMNDLGGGFDFDMSYVVSDAISSEMVRVEVWDKSCQQNGLAPMISYSSSSTTSSDLLELLVSEAYETGDGSGFQTVTVNARWKRDESDFILKLQDSNFYKENSDGSLIQVSMCVRYQLHTGSTQGGVEVNFLETPVVINIDMTAGITFNAEFELVSNQDDCLQDLQTLGGINDKYGNALIWSPGGTSADPSMPLGPSSFRSGYSSSSYSYGSASSYSSKNGDNAFFSSARAASHNAMAGHRNVVWTTAMGMMVFLVFSVLI
jgi:hypothetical protein